MNNDLYEFFDELDDDDTTEAYSDFELHRSRNPKGRISKKLETEEQTFAEAQDHSRQTFKFTYKAARFEEWWLLDSLAEFYEHKWITDVLSRVKGGKEASVYLCRSGAGIEAPEQRDGGVCVRHARNLHTRRHRPQHA